MRFRRFGICESTRILSFQNLIKTNQSTSCLKTFHEEEEEEAAAAAAGSLFYTPPPSTRPTDNTTALNCYLIDSHECRVWESQVSCYNRVQSRVATMSVQLSRLSGLSRCMSGLLHYSMFRTLSDNALNATVHAAPFLTRIAHNSPQNSKQDYVTFYLTLLS